MDELLQALARYRAAGIGHVLHQARFSHYAIVHHSTVIEGSTLTQAETNLLLDEQLSPAGRPIAHVWMTLDHHAALQQVLQWAQQPVMLTADLLQTINALVLAHTGGVVSTDAGEVDTCTGAFRLGNVRAGQRHFMQHTEVPTAIARYCDKMNALWQAVHTDAQRLQASWLAHFDLVSIHPWYDGNGRTARLVMNLLQANTNIPLGLVFQESKAAYIAALEAARQAGKPDPFYAFMAAQHTQWLQAELHAYEQGTQTNYS